MRIDTIRAVLSIVVVAAFVFVLAALALIPVMSAMDNATAIQAIKDYSAALSGVVGVIIGFYFGRHEQSG